MLWLVKKIWKLRIYYNNKYCEFDIFHYFKLHLLDLPGLRVHQGACSRSLGRTSFQDCIHFIFIVHSNLLQAMDVYGSLLCCIFKNSGMHKIPRIIKDTQSVHINVSFNVTPVARISCQISDTLLLFLSECGYPNKSEYWIKQSFKIL